MWCLAHQGLENQINFAESSHLGTDLRIDWGWKSVASHHSGVWILLSKYGQEKEFGVVPEFFQCDIGSEFGEWCRAHKGDKADDKGDIPPSPLVLAGGGRLDVGTPPRTIQFEIRLTRIMI